MSKELYQHTILVKKRLDEFETAKKGCVWLDRMVWMYNEFGKDCDRFEALCRMFLYDDAKIIREQTNNLFSAISNLKNHLDNLPKDVEEIKARICEE